MISQSALELLRQAVGKENVFTSQEDLFCYSYDATADVVQVIPDVVISPRNTDEVVAAVKVANSFKIPILTRGSGTNLSGGTVPVEGGMVLSCLKMNKILEIDVENLIARVQPGVIIQRLGDAAEPHGLLYPPDPGTVATATMGGSVAECSGGLRGLKYGVTKDYVMGLEIVLADGEVLRIGGKTVKNVTGYDLVKLFTGSEGTLGIITEIIVKLIPAPESRKSMLVAFGDITSAANTITGIIASKVIPATLEIMDRVTIETMENYVNAGLPDAEAILLIEVDGSPAQVAVEMERVVSVCRKYDGKIEIAKDDEHRDKIWAARRAALPSLAQVSPTTVLEDATVPRSEVPKMIMALQDIARKYDLKIGTFGHAGDGNLHPTILTDERNREEMERVHRAVEEIFETAVKLGGTLSGEHGIGITKHKFLPKELGDKGAEVLRRIKEALDPDYLFNPGKIIARD